MGGHDEWYDDGRWVGPPDLRLFLRTSWPFAAVWYAVITLIAVVICTDVSDSIWFGGPLGAATGGLVWLGVMFAFSRGWIAEGD